MGGCRGDGRDIIVGEGISFCAWGLLSVGTGLAVNFTL